MKKIFYQSLILLFLYSCSYKGILSGTYRLSDSRFDVANELTLNSDSSYIYSSLFGLGCTESYGKWKVSKNRLILKSEYDSLNQGLNLFFKCDFDTTLIYNKLSLKSSDESNAYGRLYIFNQNEVPRSIEFFSPTSFQDIPPYSDSVKVFILGGFYKIPFSDTINLVEVELKNYTCHYRTFKNEKLTLKKNKIIVHNKNSQLSKKTLTKVSK